MVSDWWLGNASHQSTKAHGKRVNFHFSEVKIAISRKLEVGSRQGGVEKTVLNQPKVV